MMHYFLVMNTMFFVVLAYVTESPAKHPPQNRYEVNIAAGALDRQNTAVSFLLPDHPEDGVYLMNCDSGNTVFLQVNHNKAHFILEYLQAGESKTYTFIDSPLKDGEYPVHISGELDTNSISFASEGNEILNYFHGESEVPEELDPRFKRAGYIHPVFTPEGVRVTQHFNPARPHQYGIWSAWGRSEFQGRSTEFWGSHTESGRVVVDSIEEIREGPVYGGFISKHRFVDFSISEPVTALNEKWEVVIFHTNNRDNYHIFDLHISQTANTNNPVRILEHQYGYGGINIRGHDDWNGEGQMDFQSSEGHGRMEVSFERVRWSHLSGDVEGKRAGIGVLGHPENMNHPLGVFINETEPFFSYGPLPIGDLQIEPGSPYTTRYRMVIHDGDVDSGELDRLWNDYAYPPGVTVKKLNH